MDEDGDSGMAHRPSVVAGLSESQEAQIAFSSDLSPHNPVIDLRVGETDYEVANSADPPMPIEIRIPFQDFYFAYQHRAHAYSQPFKFGGHQWYG
jgi:hypothetical protein